MTLRDYFAAKVLLASYAGYPGVTDWRDKIAKESYQMADAMMKARQGE
jgi:hypothetical protein